MPTAVTASVRQVTSPMPAYVRPSDGSSRGCATGYRPETGRMGDMTQASALSPEARDTALDALAGTSVAAPGRT